MRVGSRDGERKERKNRKKERKSVKGREEENEKEKRERLGERKDGGARAGMKTDDCEKSTLLPLVSCFFVRDKRRNTRDDRKRQETRDKTLRQETIKGSVRQQLVVGQQTTFGKVRTIFLFLFFIFF